MPAVIAELLRFAVRRRRARWSAAVLFAAAVLAPACGRPPPRNLVLITVDTLRADHLGAYGSELGATPHLDRLADQSLVFKVAYAPASFTRPSIAALLTGLYPTEAGVRTNVSLVPSDVDSLAQVLRSQGWKTGAVVSNFVLRKESGLARGFDRYDDDFPDAEASRGIPEKGGHATTAAGVAMLEQLRAAGDGPFFLWVHYQDPHGPYTPPASLRERFLPGAEAAPDGGRELPVAESQSARSAIPRYQLLEGRRDVAFYRAGYAGEVAAVDAAIGELLRAVDEAGPSETTVVAFTSDHGESLGEDDFWFGHGELVSDALTRVPLLLRVPGERAGARQDVASLLDLRPTLVRAVGARPRRELRGRNLLARGAERGGSQVLVHGFGPDMRTALISDGYKLQVLMGEEGVEARLRALGDSRYLPDDEEPEARAKLQREWERLQTDVATRARSDQLEVLALEHVDRLRALGYVEE
jgi:arylsulfatase